MYYSRYWLVASLFFLALKLSFGDLEEPMVILAYWFWGKLNVLEEFNESLSKSLFTGVMVLFDLNPAVVGP